MRPFYGIRARPGNGLGDPHRSTPFGRRRWAPPPRRAVPPTARAAGKEGPDMRSIPGSLGGALLGAALLSQSCSGGDSLDPIPEERFAERAPRPTAIRERPAAASAASASTDPSAYGVGFAHLPKARRRGRAVRGRCALLLLSLLRRRTVRSDQTRRRALLAGRGMPDSQLHRRSFAATDPDHGTDHPGRRRRLSHGLLRLSLGLRCRADVDPGLPGSVTDAVDGPHHVGRGVRAGLPSSRADVAVTGRPVFLWVTASPA
jgi:hypothetical protein